MKKKIHLFLQYFINPVTIILYIIFLYSFYLYTDDQLNKTSYDWVIQLIILGILGLILLIWFIVCIVTTIQQYEIESKLCHIKYMEKIGLVIGIIGSIVCYQGVMNIVNQHTEPFQVVNYNDDFDIIDGNWFSSLSQRIEKEMNTKEPLCVDNFYLKCDQFSNIKSSQIRIYYLKDNTRYTYQFDYQDNRIHIESLKTKNEGYDNNRMVSFKELMRFLQNEDILSDDIEVQLVYELNTKYLNYPIINHAYLQVIDPNDISQVHQNNEQYQHNNQVAQDDYYPTPSTDVNQGYVVSESLFNNGIGFRLRETDAAAGSRFYGLDKTTDGGKTWEAFNRDPFQQQLGGGAEVVFMNQDVGFISLFRGQGDYSQLFRTSDGGKTFKEIILKDNGEADYLSLPYVQDGKYYLKAAENFQSFDEIIYVSLDKGKTWTKQ